jgi:hypothetical protein
MPEASAEPTQQDIALLLPELAAAVANSPRDVTAKAKYAMALHQVGNFPAAWETLLAAYKLQPDQAGIARGMTVLWKEFEKLGIFTVGVPMETVEGVLGAPTQRVSSEAGTRWAYGFLVVEFQNGKLHETIDFRNISDEVFSP